MTAFLIGLLTCLSSFLRSRYNLGMGILAPGQQLAVLKRKQPRPVTDTGINNPVRLGVPPVLAAITPPWVDE